MPGYIGVAQDENKYLSGGEPVVRPGVYVEELPASLAALSGLPKADNTLNKMLKQAYDGSNVAAWEDKKMAAQQKLVEQLRAIEEKKLQEGIAKMVEEAVERKDTLLAATNDVLARQNKQLLEREQGLQDQVTKLSKQLDEAHERIFKLTDLVYSKWMNDGRQEGPPGGHEQGSAQEEQGTSEGAGQRDTSSHGT